MSRVVVLGAGISGHMAAAFLRRWLGRENEVIVVSPKPICNWIPSNIRVGVGLMSPADVVFPLAPVYERHGIEFKQARAVELHSEGRPDDPAPYLIAESTRAGPEGEREEIRYDFLVNATGPKLNFGATPGLGPHGHSLSVCTETHAAAPAQALEVSVEGMRRGERQRFLVGTGHGGSTCEGAAFESIVNLEFELRARGVRDRADIQWISNAYELGNFGMGGMQVVDHDLAVRVTADYGSVLAAAGARRSADAAVAAARADRDLAGNRRDAGLTTDADVLQIDVHVSRAREQQIVAAADERIARARLNHLMGAPLGETFLLEPASAPTIIDVVSLAAARLDVHVAVARLDAARAREAVGRDAVAQALESRRIIRDRYEPD